MDNLRKKKNEILDKIYMIFRKNKEMILYLIFGGCTTIINIVSYFVLYNYMKVTNFYSTIISWIFAVVFAFITNRNIVFNSKKNSFKYKLIEFFSFFGCRLMTGVLDVCIMLVAVDWMRWSALVWKIISNILVIVINYIASKFFVFREEH